MRAVMKVACLSARPKKSAAGRGSRIRTCDLKYPKLPRYQAAPYPGAAARPLDTRFGFVQQAAKTLLIQLEGRSQQVLNGEPRRLRRRLVRTEMRIGFDAGVLVGEGLAGLRVDDHAERLLLELAGADALRALGDRRRLRTERVVVGVMRAGELGQLGIAPGGAQPFEIGTARRDRHVVVGGAVELPDRDCAHVGIADERGIARGVERNVRGEGDARRPSLLEAPKA